jgi:uncharacterized repeat protein (TIGR03803 family)
MEMKMKSSILRTLRSTLVAATLPDGLLTSAAARRKLSLTKMAGILSVFCAATAILSPAQTTFKTLFSFQGSNGSNPGYYNLVQGTDGNLYGTTEVGGGTAEGTVFKFATTASKPTTLYKFCATGSLCPNGSKPYAGLVLASNGKFYGTTTLGGTTDNGTVFQITSTGSFKTIYNFGGTTTGSLPWATPIQAKDGDLYGGTSIGGTDNDGVIYAISTAGKLDDSLTFTGGNGIYPFGKPVQGTDGNFYGTTGEVESGDGTVFVVKEAAINTLHKFTGTDGGDPIGGLVQASNGTFYGTTSTDGGHLQGGTVFSITAAGTFKTIYSFCAKTNCTDGSTPYATLIQASDGNLYGTTYLGGANNTNCNGGCGTIFKITTAGKLTTLYNFCSQKNCTDGYQPEGGLVQATNGTLYGTTYYGGTADSGTVFSLSVGLKPFVKILSTLGTAGDNATILGDNLTGATKVNFNGLPAAFTVVSSTEIEATVPTGATTGTVTVVTPGGTLESNSLFQVD